MSAVVLKTVFRLVVEINTRKVQFMTARVHTHTTQHYRRDVMKHGVY